MSQSPVGLSISALDGSTNAILECLEQAALTDLDYYALSLAQLLPDQMKVADVATDEFSRQLALQKNILLQQARHLVRNGESEALYRSDRLERFGDDRYIARNIARLLLTPDPSPDFVVDCLRRISDSANLHGVDALIHLLHNPDYREGFEFPPNFDLEQWQSNWENSSLRVPFSPQRVLRFLRDRFNQILTYPDGFFAATTLPE